MGYICTFPLFSTTKPLLDKRIDVRLLRHYLTNLLLLRYEGGEYEQADTQKMIYEMLLFLVSTFTLTGLVPQSSPKIDVVADYIDANFQDVIS